MVIKFSIKHWCKRIVTKRGFVEIKGKEKTAWMNYIKHLDSEQALYRCLDCGECVSIYTTKED